MASLNGRMEGEVMVWWLAQNALVAAILAAGVDLATRVGRFGPSAKHALWLLVILKLLAPPIPAWSWPGEVSSPARVMETANAAAAPASLDLEYVKGVALNALAGMWLAGAAGVAMSQGLRLYRLRAAMRRGAAPPRWLIEEADALATGLGVSRPRIATVPGTGSPLLVGALRPVLVVPEALLARLGRSAWRSVVAHELVHLKRRDHWVGGLELVGACVWWWNPVFWYAWRRLRENAEYACDAWVVRALPDGRRAYAESLISVVDTFSRNAVPVGAIGMASGGKDALERRLKMILREAVPHRMSPLAVTAAVMTALVILPGWTRPKVAEAEPVAVVQTDRAGEMGPIGPIGPIGQAGQTDRTDRTEATSRAQAQPDAKPAQMGMGRASETSKPAKKNHGAVPKKAGPVVGESRPAPKGVAEASAVAMGVQPGFARATPTQLADDASKPAVADAAVKPGTMVMSPAPVETGKTDSARAGASSGGVQKVEVHGSVKIRFDKYSRY